MDRRRSPSDHIERNILRTRIILHINEVETTFPSKMPFLDMDIDSEIKAKHEIRIVYSKQSTLEICRTLVTLIDSPSRSVSRVMFDSDLSLGSVASLLKL